MPNLEDLNNLLNKNWKTIAKLKGIKLKDEIEKIIRTLTTTTYDDVDNKTKEAIIDLFQSIIPMH